LSEKFNKELLDWFQEYCEKLYESREKKPYAPSKTLFT
jgi:hypothetical protein